MPYFTVMQGLRGCYMPDSCYTMRAATRRELKAAIEDEARVIRDSGFVGCNKRDVANFAAMCWRNRKTQTLSYVLPYGERGNGRPYAIHVSAATRHEFNESQKET